MTAKAERVLFLSETFSEGSAVSLATTTGAIKERAAEAGTA